MNFDLVVISRVGMVVVRFEVCSLVSRVLFVMLGRCWLYSSRLMCWLVMNLCVLVLLCVMCRW